MSFEMDGIVKIELINRMGQQVQIADYRVSTGLNQLALDGNTLQEGLYIYKIWFESKLIREGKVIKLDR